MKKISAKDLMNEQKKRFAQLRQREQDSSTTEDAKANFRRTPYMGMYRNRYQRGNVGIERNSEAGNGSI